MKHFLQIIFIMMLCVMLTGCIFTARKVEQTKPVTTTPTTTISTPTYTEIKISSADEFLQNIKPYTKIILTEDYYNLSSITSEVSLDTIEVDDWFEGNEYTIHDIDHLEICTENNQTAKMVVTSGHVNVLNFRNCHDIKLNGLVLGHEVEKGTCFGGVLHLEECQNIEVDDCHFYGCGTYGIIASDTASITIRNSEIYDCTEGILHFDHCQNATFENTSFHNNQEYSGFVLSDCQNFTIKNCSVTENLCDENCSLFFTSHCSGIVMEDCTFRDNTYPAFGEKEDYTMTNCIVEDENFDEPIYYDVEPDYESDYYYDVEPDL